MNIKIKRFSLLILVIAFFSLGAFAQSESTIPTNFTTYTDELSLFKISYPVGWELDLSRIKTLKQETEEYLKSINSRGTLEKSNIVFFGGVPLDGGYNPNISIFIVPLGNEKVNLEGLEYVLKSAVQGFKKDAEEFHELSWITIIIDGKQAMLLESEVRYPYFNSMHSLHAFLSGERFIWIITCVVIQPLNFNDFKDDIYAMVKSFKILWETVSIQGLCTFQIPPTVEIQNETYKRISGQAKKMVLDISQSSDSVIAQPKGINDLDPVALKKYCRIIVGIERGTKGDYARLDEPLLVSEAELEELDKEFKNQLDQQAAMWNAKGVKMTILSWQPFKINRVNGVYALVNTYTRSINDAPSVLVQVYRIQNNDVMHTITISYRESEKDIWADDLGRVINTFKFEKR